MIKELLVKPEHAGQFFEALDNIFQNKADSAQVAKVTAVVQAFIDKPMHAHIQAFTTKGDFPQIVTDMPDFIRQFENYDLNWQLAFRERTLDPGRFEWEIVTQTDTITWRLMGEGEQARVESLSGSVAYGKCHRYSAAIGWTYDLIAGRRLGTMLDMALDARNAYWKDQADRHYLLLGTAAGALNTTYDSAGSTVLDKDINTLNNAAVDLTTKVKDKGIGDAANAQLILFAQPALKARIIRAITNTVQDGLSGPNRVVYNIQPVFTYNSNLNASTSKAVMVLPGFKIQRATALEMLALTQQDHLSLTYTQAFHSYRGAIVADADQTRLVAFA